MRNRCSSTLPHVQSEHGGCQISIGVARWRHRLVANSEKVQRGSGVMLDYHALSLLRQVIASLTLCAHHQGAPDLPRTVPKGARQARCSSRCRPEILAHTRSRLESGQGIAHECAFMKSVLWPRQMLVEDAAPDLQQFSRHFESCLCINLHQAPTCFDLRELLLCRHPL